MVFRRQLDAQVFLPSPVSISNFGGAQEAASKLLRTACNETSQRVPCCAALRRRLLVLTGAEMESDPESMAGDDDDAAVGAYDEDEMIKTMAMMAMLAMRF